MEGGGGGGKGVTNWAEDDGRKDQGGELIVRERQRRHGVRWRYWEER